MTTTWLYDVAVGYTWSWPILETLHFFGMGLLLGIIITIDLRLVGFFRRVIPLGMVHDLLPWAILGFVINLITGIFFLFGDPFRYYYSPAFMRKAILIAVAGLNALWYWLALEKKIDTLGDHADTPVSAKMMGLISIGAWVGVAIFGRLIPYL